VALSSPSFSIADDVLSTSTGWHGRAPKPSAQREIHDLYCSGEINKFLAYFYPLYYSMLPK
jgi:hypothetical protein